MNNNNQSHIPPGMLLRLIQGKQEIVAYYECLRKLTDDKQSSGMISEIIMDERMHLELFLTLYTNLFGNRPELRELADPVIDLFIEGVRHAMLAELNTYSFYGNIFFTDPNIEVRDTFSRAVFDENLHAAKLNFIYHKLLVEDRLN